MNWDEICKPLYNGGLGIRKPKIMNTAFIMKLCFQLLSNKNCFWAKIIMGKYKCDNFNEAAIRNGQRISNLWRAMIKARDEVQPGVKWVVVNGSQTRF